MTEGMRMQLKVVTSELQGSLENSRVFERLRAGQKDIKHDFLELLGEVAKIQQALNVDFAHVANDSTC